MSKKVEEDTIEVNLPEDLGTLSDSELEALRQGAKDAFNELYQDGAELSAEQDEALDKLKAAKLALDAEKNSRNDAKLARSTKAAEMAALFADDPEPEVEEDDAEEVEADAPAADAVAASATPADPIKVSVARVKRHNAPVDLAPAAQPNPFRSLTAGIVGEETDLGWIADKFQKFSKGKSANKAGESFSQREDVAQIVKPFDPRACVGDGVTADDAIKFVTDQSRLPGGSLVAAGGWCAPSETLYDLCELESRDGLISIPEIRVNRGGIRFTTGPDWADIFLSTGFCFTEAEDVAGTYSTNEVQSLTEGGAGLTSFTLTFGGNTTASIPASATVAQITAALQALPSIGAGNVYVTGPAGASNGPWNVIFVNSLGNTNVATITSTPTGGTGTLVVAVVTQGGGAAGSKPCALVPCPDFTDVRLNVCGVCIQPGILLDRAYPELVRRYVSGAITAHMHRVATNVIASLVAGSTAVSPTQLATPTESAVLAPLLSAIELQAEDIRYRRRMARGTTLEAIFPFWARGVIRADLSRRLGLADPFGVSDGEIDNWFRMRGINPQFVYNWQNLGAPGAALAYPATINFLIFPAGTWVRGSSDVITLQNMYDSALYSNNNFTAIFTEEGWSVMKLCHDSRNVTVPICPAGTANIGVALDCTP